MSTDDGFGGEGMSTASAPPEMEVNSPIYPVLQQQVSPHQQQYQPMQPQQVVYGQHSPHAQQPPQYAQYAQAQPIQQQQAQPMPMPVQHANSQQYLEQKENQQLDMEIGAKFDELSKALAERKQAILAQCQISNSEQKKDVLESLRRVLEGIGEIKIDPNIQPKVQHSPQPQPQVVHAPILHQQSGSNVIMVQQPVVQQQVVYISDTWNTHMAHPNLVFDATQQTVFSKVGGDWLNAFGNQVIQKGQHKRWNVRILARTQPKNAKAEKAEVVVGVVDAKKVSNRAGGFWLGPMLGYGYYGFSGKKFHTKKAGMAYSKRKFGVGDVVSIEINMAQFELYFHVKGKDQVEQPQGKAFPIDARNSYVLAVAMSSPDFMVQLC